jgi:hypothetical protein
MTSLAIRARSWFTAHHLAQLGVLAQLLAGFRAVGEYFRLQWAGGAAPQIVGPLLLGAMLAIAGGFISVVLYFFGRDRLAIAMTVVGIVGLIAYKLIALPSLG